MNKLIVKKAAVLGAGVMGAQIAAHLANANVPVVLFDLPAREGDKNGVVNKALDGLKKLDPAPLANKGKLKFIDAANYEEHLSLLADCDLVIEAIAERMDWKNELYAKIAPHLGANAVIASNTSGLSINTLAEGLPETVRPRFCGIHFFNPPRYMHLVEIIATRTTDAGDARCPRNLADLAPWQGRHPRPRYAEFRRQPHRRFFHPRGHASHRRLRPWLRRSRCADRPAHRPSEERHLPHRRRRRSRYPGARRQDHAGHAAERSVARLLQDAGMAVRADRQGRTRPEDPLRNFPQAGQGNPGA